jgi:hypothetical protein
MKTVPGGVKAVSGLGESAYFQPSENQFFAYKGKTKVSINFAGAGSNPAKVETSEKALAQSVASAGSFLGAAEFFRSPEAPPGTASDGDEGVEVW